MIDDDAVPGPAVFNIQEISTEKTSSGERRTWLAIHDAQGKTALFRIQLNLQQPKGDSPFAFVAGMLIREQKSDGSGLLKDVARALGAKSIPKGAARVEKLPFQAAILGSYPDPKGNIHLKLFLADGAGEVYLNLNPGQKRGEFSMKDEGYADIVMEELSKVLSTGS